MPAQHDIYGRDIVTLADLDLGDSGPHAIPANNLRDLLTHFSENCPANTPPGISQERWQLGPFHVIPLTSGATPQRDPRYRMSPRERAELDKQTDTCLHKDGSANQPHHGHAAADSHQRDCRVKMVLGCVKTIAD